MSDDKIIKGLECCGSRATLCSGCPYYDFDISCVRVLTTEALNLVERLKRKNADPKKA